MLKSLAIRDFVIVDSIELEFGHGFTVLTGETGAGKSILIDALAMVLGERSDPGVVRNAAERAEIAAEFEVAHLPAFEAWLKANELEGDAGSCLLRRVIDAGGRSRAFVNGRPCTLAQLREAGEFLVDIHGQHVHQSLLRPAAQRALLDAYGGLASLAQEVERLYRRWRELAAQVARLEQDAARLERERSELAYQVSELEGLNTSHGEWDTLQEDHKRLANAASLIETAQLGVEILAESDAACLTQLATVTSRVGAAVAHDARLAEAHALLGSAQAELQEATSVLRSYGSRLELDPARLAEVERRIEAIHAAARRFRVSPANLPLLLEESRAALAKLDAGLDAGALRREAEDAREAYVEAARRLSRARGLCAPELSSKVSAAMQDLAMAGGRFAATLSALIEGGPQGFEEVEFQVGAHAGVPLRPLAKVASGGELSRVSLAIQTATSQVAEVPTLIFDEVDAGIGGRVAELVGRLLKDLGRRHQVMCITHLPQVAAAADAQWRVAKTETQQNVLTRVTALDGDNRVEEIARMLGGVKITQTTRRHAEEMLALAQRAPAER